MYLQTSLSRILQLYISVTYYMFTCTQNPHYIQTCAVRYMYHYTPLKIDSNGEFLPGADKIQTWCLFIWVIICFRGNSHQTASGNSRFLKGQPTLFIMYCAKHYLDHDSKCIFYRRITCKFSFEYD